MDISVNPWTWRRKPTSCNSKSRQKHEGMGMKPNLIWIEDLKANINVLRDLKGTRNKESWPYDPLRIWSTFHNLWNSNHIMLNSGPSGYVSLPGFVKIVEKQSLVEAQKAPHLGPDGTFQ